MKILKIKQLNKAGDTIVEVMIVLAVLGLSLGISYATANLALNQSQNAQEHSTALGIITSQLELLRTAIDSNAPGISSIANSQGSGTYFCMNPVNSAYHRLSTVPTTYTADQQGNYSEYQGTPCHVSEPINYYFSISPASSSDQTYNYTTPSIVDDTSYTFVVRWDGLGNLGPQQESMTYRIATSNVGQLTTGVNPPNSGQGTQGGHKGSPNPIQPSSPTLVLGNYFNPTQLILTQTPTVLTDAGANYSACVNGEVLFNDGADGCFPKPSQLTGSMYAYRQVFVVYAFPSSQTAAQTTITVNYNQLPGTSIASNYNFELYACAVPSGTVPVANNQPEPTNPAYYDTYPPTSVSTGPCASPSNELSLPGSYSANSQSFTVSNYQAGDSIELDWVNNVTIAPNDPNLEINSVTLQQYNY
jgi:type II secretory pathway pseudopilin PulG